MVLESPASRCRLENPRALSLCRGPCRFLRTAMLVSEFFKEGRRAERFARSWPQFVGHQQHENRQYPEHAVSHIDIPWIRFSGVRVRVSSPR